MLKRPERRRVGGLADGDPVGLDELQPLEQAQPERGLGDRHDRAVAVLEVLLADRGPDDRALRAHLARRARVGQRERQRLREALLVQLAAALGGPLADVLERDAHGGVDRGDAGRAVHARDEGGQLLLVVARPRQHVDRLRRRRVVARDVRTAGRLGRVEDEGDLLRAQAVALAADAHGHVARHELVAVRAVDRAGRLRQRLAADVEPGDGHARPDHRLRRLGARGGGEQHREGESGGEEPAHPEQSSRHRSRCLSSSAHVVPRAARPVSTPRWPPGAVSRSSEAAFGTSPPR